MALDGSYQHDRASQLDATDASMDEVATVSNGLDRGRVYMEEQAILLRHDNIGVNVECRVPSSPLLFMNRVSRPGSQVPGASDYADTKTIEAQARVPPLARAEEDSLASPFGIGEEAHKHMKRKVRRTIRRFFMDGQTYYRGHHLVTGAQLAAFFGQATVQRVWNPAREAQRIEQQQRRQRHRRYRQTLAGDIHEFRDGEAHLRFAPAVTASQQVTLPKKTGYMTFNVQSLVRSGRVNLIATYMIDKKIQVAGLQGTRLGGGRIDYRIRASPLDTKSAQFVVFQWVTEYQHEHWSLDSSAC